MAESDEEDLNLENSPQEEEDENSEFIVESDSEKSFDGPVQATKLSGMYKEWFLDYASYVILERAVPHVYDGLKPVQRRILHAMKNLDDGRYNKVANIIGFTMQYHPHGDASIGDALVQLGQKDLVIDTQGNWGNILTGDSSAAPRYIEARLSKFALDVVFNPKTTYWKSSYDGRNKEPIALPMKFPLLLAQGVEGIAVGLASKILPHNFNELIDASISILQEKEFELFPDFPTGGFADCSKYNDGLRGGKVRVRARIEKLDKKTLVVREIPFGKTTTALIESIINANDKGKIKIKKIDDNTAENVEILIHLVPGVSPDKTIDALYAFTDCEISISPNACVIEDDKPRFIGISEILNISAYNTVNLLKRELEIRKDELEHEWHLASLEKWFIENRIYKKKGYEDAVSTDAAIVFIDECLKTADIKLLREVTRDNLLLLLEIKMKRILKFNSDKSDQHLRNIEEEIEKINHHLSTIIDYTIAYFREIKKKYGKGKERKTELRNFDTIIATKVVANNEKLYVNRKEGFFGTGLKKEEYVCDCSDIADIIIFRKDGKYIVTKVSDKSFFGKDIEHIAVFKKNDNRTIYNAVYRDGKNGTLMVKRFAVTGVTRDKEYDITKGNANSKLLYFSANPNGEAEIIKVFLKPKPKLRKLVFEFDFSEQAIKGRDTQGNILSKFDAHKIVMKEKGVSTLGGRKIWFDDAVFRINNDERGRYIGTYSGEDRIIVFSKSGYYRTTSFDLANHYEDDILIIEKYNPNTVYSAVFYDAEQKFYYLKRFNTEDSEKENSIIGENEESKLILITKFKKPQVEIVFGGKHAERENEIVDVAEFIGVKSHKARGKRLSNYEIKKVTEIDPLEAEELEEEINEELDTDNKADDVMDNSSDNSEPDTDVDNSDDSEGEEITDPETIDNEEEISEKDDEPVQKVEAEQVEEIPSQNEKKEIPLEIKHTSESAAKKDKDKKSDNKKTDGDAEQIKLNF